ncbi:hypothetical protein BBJ28_00016229 [Nothophytophthora sp. Chile5]|nr:hypothetical protein BBJ28_00016229 [Nothophytophthora sp. Chile5]
MEAAPVAPASAGGFADAGSGGSAGSRYDALLRQIVQLNTDLQKTAALSQTLQRERDDVQQLNVKLIAKWKKQLEVKARAFETLQKKFAPPRDLEQLRIKIQEEMEGPYQQRIESLQDEVERHRQLSFDLRREFEVLKAEYEQFSIDQDVREEMMRLSEQTESEKSARELRLADEATRKTTFELDLKACSRQLTKAKDECEGFRSKWDHMQSKLLELTTESEHLRDQLKQKEALIFNSHNSLTTKYVSEVIVLFAG